jgi:hypothetical protein
MREMTKTSDDKKVEALQQHFDGVLAMYLGHRDPSGLTPAEKQAFDWEDEGITLMLKAAAHRLRAAEEMRDLLKAPRT